MDELQVENNEQREQLKNQATEGGGENEEPKNTNVMSEDDTGQKTGEGEAGTGQDGEGEKILGRFNSYEELAEAFQELESKLPSDSDSGSQDSDSSEVESENQDQPQVSIQDAVQKALQDGLTEEDYAALEAQGWTRDLVDMQVQGARAMQQQAEETAYSITGGKENYRAMVQWAANNLTDAEARVFDQAVNSGDPASIKIAVQGLYSQWTAAEGSPAQRSVSSQGRPQDSSSEVYQSWQEVTQDMRTQKYRKDPAERERVAAKLMRSRI